MTQHRPVIAGNWKMHHGPAATRAFLEDFTPEPGASAPRILLFPPMVSLAAATSFDARDRRIEFGVQNTHEAEEGAFTGEISARMAAEVGAELALVGHSERRHVFGESDERVAAKTRAALAAGLIPVVCVGETLEERQRGELETVLLRQLDAVLPELRSATDALVAYEPVWAIGTGETATPADAAQAHALIRRHMAAVLGPERAEQVPILYGGSVRPSNARELLSADDVDGLLIGGASLDPRSFAEIVELAS